MTHTHRAVAHRKRTISEKKFEEKFPQAIPVLTWFDYLLYEMPVEVKECVMNHKGAFKIKMENHEDLVEADGMYFLVLKQRLPGGKSLRLRYRWLVASAINPENETKNTYMDRGHRNDTEQREMMHIKWARYFEDNRYESRSNFKIQPH